jgi:hypothetical protein
LLTKYTTSITGADFHVTASTPIGIKSFGAYIPRRRIPRAVIAAAHAWALPSLKSLGKGEKAFCGWDEDAITMAVEAGRDCLRGAPGAAQSVGGLCFASTTAPYADLQNGSIVGAALRLPEARTSADFTGSLRAGVTNSWSPPSAAAASPAARRKCSTVAAPPRSASVRERT